MGEKTSFELILNQLLVIAVNITHTLHDQKVVSYGALALDN
jgi:hypothetical protein